MKVKKDMKPAGGTEPKEIVVSRKLVYGVGIGLVILAALLLSGRKLSIFSFGRSQNATDGHPVAGADLVAGSPEKFAFLSGQGGPRSVPNTCGLSPASVQTMPDDARIQGSCCQPMDLQHYQKQVEDLKKYGSIAQIPNDPYDVPVSLVKQNLEYDKTIQLTADQQAIYDQATQMADDKGPCCCKCWRWYSNEGQARYFISQLHWSAEQVATTWDTEEGCGGSGDAPG